jgi:hypothetical protein
VSTFQTALGQTTLFVVRLLVVSSPIHPNLAIIWPIGQKQFFPTSNPNFHNFGVKLKNTRSWYKRNTIFGETMMHSSNPWAQ